MNLNLEKQFEVCSYDVDIFKKLKVSSAFGFFQEIASQHAEQLGVGFNDLSKTHNAFWALARIKIKVLKYPLWQDFLTYKTWPKGYNRLFGFRDFEIFNKNELVAAGSSDWLIMDINSKQIVNPQIIIKNIKPQLVTNQLGVETNKVKPTIDYSDKSYRIARFNDLDMNNHVNSIRYLDWVFDCLPIDFLSTHELAELSINYVHEIPANAEVEIQYTCTNKLNYNFLGKVKNADSNSFLMELIFRKS